ncbi:MAG: PEGA domain-containing protein [Calditrichaeota bacterium]|nr:PEGA domain-containing protein [Calditrichota bacterium]
MKLSYLRMMWQTGISALLVLLMTFTLLQAQQLQQMEFEELKADNVILDDASRSLLIVESTVPKLMFESTRGIKPGSVKEEKSGVWHVYLEPGVQLVTIMADGYLDIELGRHNYQPRRARKIRVKGEQPKGIGSLLIETEPPDCDIWINNYQLLNRSPVQLDNQPIGKTYIQIEKAGYVLICDTVIIEKDTLINKYFKLKRKLGTLFVNSIPDRADIYLNGQRKGQTPTIINDLPTGDYEIRLQKSGYDIQLGTVRVEQDQQAEYSMTLGTKETVEWKKRRTQARKLSFIPGAGQFTSKQYVRGGVYVGAFLGSVAMVFLVSQDYSSAEIEYNNALLDFTSAEDQVSIDQQRAKVQASFDDMQSASDRAKVFIISASGVYVWQFIDTWMWGGGKRPVSGRYSSLRQIEPYASTDEHITKVGLKITWGGR